MSQSDLRMLRDHLDRLEHALGAMITLCHQGQAKHIDESDLMPLKRVSENLRVELDAQARGGTGATSQNAG